MTPTGILVIDDDRQMLEGLGKLQRHEGYRVALASDGATGLRMLREEPSRWSSPISGCPSSTA